MPDENGMPTDAEIERHRVRELERITDAAAQPDLTTPFEPCAVHYSEGDYTEMALRDVPTIWCNTDRWCDIGYDMETGELVAIRVAGDITKRK